MRNSLYSTLAALLILPLFTALPAQAQDSDELANALSRVGQQYATNYTQPVTDALGADMNAGLFRTAGFDGTGLLPMIDVYVGVSVAGAFTAGSPDSFELSNDEIEANGRTLRIEYPNGSLPTAFGDNDSPGTAALIDTQTETQVGEVRLPGSIIDTPIAPLVVPQVGVGTVFGTDAQVRYLPEIGYNDYGSVSLFGVAVRHSLSQYIPLSPVSVAVQGSWQSLSLSGREGSQNPGEIVDASGWALNAQVSKDVPVLPITFYGGVQYEKFGVDVDYTFATTVNGQEKTSRIRFEQDAANNVRALAGVSLTLALFKVNVDYALSSNNTVSAGVGLAL
jgi:hypothetical protein